MSPRNSRFILDKSNRTFRYTKLAIEPKYNISYLLLYWFHGRAGFLLPESNVSSKQWFQCRRNKKKATHPNKLMVVLYYHLSSSKYHIVFEKCTTICLFKHIEIIILLLVYDTSIIVFYKSVNFRLDPIISFLSKKDCLKQGFLKWGSTHLIYLFFLILLFHDFVQFWDLLKIQNIHVK